MTPERRKEIENTLHNLRAAGVNEFANLIHELLAEIPPTKPVTLAVSQPPKQMPPVITPERRKEIEVFISSWNNSSPGAVKARAYLSELLADIQQAEDGEKHEILWSGNVYRCGCGYNTVNREFAQRHVDQETIKPSIPQAVSEPPKWICAARVPVSEARIKPESSVKAARRIYDLYCHSSYFKSISPEYTQKMLEGWARIISQEFGIGNHPGNDYEIDKCPSCHHGENPGWCSDGWHCKPDHQPLTESDERPSCHDLAASDRPSCHRCGSNMIKCHGCTSCGEHTLATVQAQPWIPVIERLPDIGKWVHLVIEGVVQVMPARLIIAVFEDGKKYWEWADDTAFASPLEAASLWQYIPHYSPGVKTEYQSREVLPQKPGQQCGLCGECESLRQQRDAARKVIKVMMGRQSNRPWSEYTDSEVDSWIEETKGLVSMQPRMFTAWCSRPDCRKAYTADTAEHAAVNAQQCNHI
jgi:hypothetical protein